MNRLLISLLCISSGYNYGAASSSAGAAELPQTYFSTQTARLKRTVNDAFHPILHGCAEPLIEGYFDQFKNKMAKTGSLIYSGNFSDALKEIGNGITSSVAKKALKTAAIGCIEKYSKTLSSTLFRSGVYNDDNDATSGDDKHTGVASLQAMLDADQDPTKTFSNWRPTTMCPEGICKCTKLGINSKAVLIAMNRFIDHINSYEGEKRLPFFSTNAETDRIVSILLTVMKRLAELNIKSILTTKESQPADDKELIPCLQMVEKLVAIPTGSHNIAACWKKNQTAIDKLLSTLPLHEQDELYEYMRVLVSRATNQNYGYKPGDSSTNLLFAGPSGSGKTFTAKEIIRLLGFPVITMTLDEILSHPSCEPADRLIDKGKISELEKKLLCLRPDKQSGISSIHPIIFIDEIDEDRTYTISDLKEKFDQFQHLRLISIGVTIPGFLNCIFTTNNTTLVKNDPALAGRFIQINFPPMPVDSKINILFNNISPKFKSNLVLKQKYDDTKIRDIVKKYVKFNSETNLRILLAHVDGIVSHFDTEARASKETAYLVPPSRRNGQLETLDEFLLRKLGRQQTISIAESSYIGKGKGKRKPTPKHKPSAAYSSDDELEEDSSSDSD